MWSVDTVLGTARDKYGNGLGPGTGTVVAAPAAVVALVDGKSGVQWGPLWYISSAVRSPIIYSPSDEHHWPN